MDGARGGRRRPIGPDAKQEGRRGRGLLAISRVMHAPRLLRHVRPAELRPSSCWCSTSERPEQSISERR